jgi:hypothetical protein
MRTTRNALLAALLSVCASAAFAWSNHAMVTYRALERVPELGPSMQVVAEPLEAFLKNEEKAIADLLATDEAWARTALEAYPPRPDALAFTADPARSDAERRKAFLAALRVSPESRLALYFQPDPWGPAPDPARLLPPDAVNALKKSEEANHVFVRLEPGEPVPALAVVASASDEPDYGMDLNLWSDSNSAAGRSYGFGKLPFGNPTLSFSTQAPFHMGFFHEPAIMYMAAPFLKRTYPLLRIHQYTGLARLAFDTGHPYWGWRFTGLAMHYVQDLTQPYHASVSPGNSAARLIGINALAMAGLPKWKDEMIVLLSNRHLALENYESALIRGAAKARTPGLLGAVLHDTAADTRYPAWSDRYVRDVVSKEAYDAGAATDRTIVEALPARYVAEPGFDFGVHSAQIDLAAELAASDADQRARLDTTIATLLGHFGTHSRALVQNMLTGGVRK